MNYEMVHRQENHGMLIDMDKSPEQAEVERSIAELMARGYVQSPERFRQLRSEATKHPTFENLRALWSEEFRPNREEFKIDFNEETGVFGEANITSDNPRDNINFWVTYALKPRPELKGSFWNEAKNRRYDVSTKRAKEYNELEDKSRATDEQNASALLVTLSQIEAVKPIMTDVYPYLEWDAIAEAEEAMTQLLDEISKGKQVVLDEHTTVYLPSLKRSVALPLITIMLISAMVIASCGAQPVSADKPGGHETLVVAATQTTAAQIGTATLAPTSEAGEPDRGAEFYIDDDRTILVEGTPIIRSTHEAPTLSPLPADVLAVLKDEKYTMTDTNGDGQKDIVAENGDTLFQFVSEADRVNPEDEWQRMITFTLENGDKMEMARFETPEDAYDYMVKNDILWKTSWGTKDLSNTQEKKDFFMKKIAKIPEIDRKIMRGVFPNNKDNSSKTHIMVYSAGEGTVVVFLTDEDNLQAIYVDDSVTTVIAGMHL